MIFLSVFLAIRLFDMEFGAIFFLCVLDCFLDLELAAFTGCVQIRPNLAKKG